MIDLSALRAKADDSHAAFLAAIEGVVPGYGAYHWYRALSDSGTLRKNNDTSHDAELAASTAIREAHKTFIRDLHAFYGARDGDRGVLGSKGL